MGKNVLDRFSGSEPTSRSSTLYSTRTGVVVTLAAIALTFLGVYMGLINTSNIVEVLWAYFIFAASLFGINMARISVESVAKSKPDEKKD